MWYVDSKRRRRAVDPKKNQRKMLPISPDTVQYTRWIFHAIFDFWNVKDHVDFFLCCRPFLNFFCRFLFFLKWDVVSCVHNSRRVDTRKLESTLCISYFGTRNRRSFGIWGAKFMLLLLSSCFLSELLIINHESVVILKLRMVIG